LKARPLNFIQWQTHARTGWTPHISSSYDREMRIEDHPAERWRYVETAEFERWLKAFPRPLEVDPPLDRKARFRGWSDPTLGSYPANVVAKMWRIGKNGGQQVRDDLR
jgi:hypothetical protein